MHAAPDANELKRAVARAALEEARALPENAILGVGTGSTVNAFIELLPQLGDRLQRAVSSSEASTARLRAVGWQVVEANAIGGTIPLYIDGADEIDPSGCMIKGGGAALTREKIVADLAERFLCIADGSKRVDVLGRYPLPIEVVPMAAAQITRRLYREYGGDARIREGVVTDNGMALLDVHGLVIRDPLAMEDDVSRWPGVVTVGIFARHRAQVCLLATPDGVERLIFD